jgi:hypothetical protein
MAEKAKRGIGELALRTMCLVAVAKGKVYRDDWTVFRKVLVAFDSPMTQEVIRENVLNTCKSLKGVSLTTSAAALTEELKGIDDAGRRRLLAKAIGILSAGVTLSEAKQVVQLLSDALQRSEPLPESATSECAGRQRTEIALLPTPGALTARVKVNGDGTQDVDAPLLEPAADFVFADRAKAEPTRGYWECPRCGSNDIYIGSTSVTRQGGMLLHEIGDTGFMAAHAVGGGSEIVEAVKCRRCGELLIGDRDYRRSLDEIALEKQLESQAIGKGCLSALLAYAIPVAVMLPIFSWNDPSQDQVVLAVLCGIVGVIIASVLYMGVLSHCGFDLRRETRFGDVHSGCLLVVLGAILLTAVIVVGILLPGLITDWRLQWASKGKVDEADARLLAWGVKHLEKCGESPCSEVIPANMMPSRLYLRRVSSVTPGAARILASLSGCDLILHDLKSLEPAVAEELARHSGELELIGLTGLSEQAAQALSRHDGPLCLMRLKALTNTALARQLVDPRNIDVMLHLNGLAELSPEIATILAQCRQSLHLDGLATLSVETAKALAEHKADRDKYLSINGLTTLSDEAAEALASHQGKVSLAGLTKLSNRAAAALRANPDIELPKRFRE